MPRRPSARWIARAGRATLAAVLLASVAVLGALGYYRVTGHELVAVRGASMGDALPLGSLAVAEQVPAARVAVGDVLLVVRRPLGRPAPTPFVHRVAHLEREGPSVVVTTKGDANARADEEPYVLPPVVLLVRHSLPYAGFTASVASTPWARMATLSLLVLVVATALMKRILRRGDEVAVSAVPAR